jgi:hypothetical protein
MLMDHLSRVEMSAGTFCRSVRRPYITHGGAKMSRAAYYGVLYGTTSMK